MDSEVAILTVVTRDYLHFARAMIESVRAMHPELPVFICLADRPEPPFDPDAEAATVFFGDELGISRWHRFAFQYDGLELSCALKPFAMEYVLAQGYKRVVYIDADILVYARLDELLDSIKNHRLVLTPHLIHPLPLDGKVPDELTIARAGVVNGGFVGFNNERDGSHFLPWWKHHCEHHCIVDQEGGLFVDQRWLDLALVMFDDVHVDRSPQYNVAYWNIPYRGLSRDEQGQWIIGDKLLAFYHFSGWRADEPENLSRYQTRVNMDEHPVARDLLLDYRARLDRFGLESCRRQGSAFTNLSCGIPIERAWREVIRVDHPALVEVDNPFEIRPESPEMARLKKSAVDVIPNRVRWHLEEVAKQLAYLCEVNRKRAAEAPPPKVSLLRRIYRRVFGSRQSK